MVKLAGGTHFALGVWLAVSAFLWAHSSAQESNACMVGIVAAATAALGLKIARLRWINGVLALWLFVSAWMLPHVSSATIWNSVIVSMVMFSVSIIETSGSLNGAYPPRSLS